MRFSIPSDRGLLNLSVVVAFRNSFINWTEKRRMVWGLKSIQKGDGPFWLPWMIPAASLFLLPVQSGLRCWSHRVQFIFNLFFLLLFFCISSELCILDRILVKLYLFVVAVVVVALRFRLFVGWRNVPNQEHLTNRDGGGNEFEKAQLTLHKVSFKWFDIWNIPHMRLRKLILQKRTRCLQLQMWILSGDVWKEVMSCQCFSVLGETDWYTRSTGKSAQAKRDDVAKGNVVSLIPFTFLFPQPQGFLNFQHLWQHGGGIFSCSLQQEMLKTRREFRQERDKGWSASKTFRQTFRKEKRLQFLIKKAVLDQSLLPFLWYVPLMGNSALLCCIHG